MAQSDARTGKAVAGALMALAGVGVLIALVSLTYCHSMACERALLALGLGLPPLISGVALTATLAGLWMLWSAARRT